MYTEKAYQNMACNRLVPLSHGQYTTRCLCVMGLYHAQGFIAHVLINCHKKDKHIRILKIQVMISGRNAAQQTVKNILLMIQLLFLFSLFVVRYYPQILMIQLIKVWNNRIDIP